MGEKTPIPLLAMVRQSLATLHLPTQAELLVDLNSLDRSIRIQAERGLRRFQLEPHREVEMADTVDLMELFDRYSPLECDAIANNVTELQLTTDCNGECPFCFLGKKKTVSHKFSFASLKAFAENYLRGKYMPVLYWDSDPFDYRDEGHDFTDVFQVMSRYTRNPTYVSTAVPKGTQERVVRFALELANIYSRAMIGREKRFPITTEYNFPVSLRFSIAKHNVQRVESVLTEIEGQLRQSRWNDTQIVSFFEDVIEFNDLLTRKPNNIGPYIHRKRRFGEMESPACQDGIVISPHRGVEAILMVAPTEYDPSGQRYIPLQPGNVLSLIPTPVYLVKYHGFDTPNRMSQRLKRQELQSLPFPRPYSGFHDYIVPGGPAANIVFKLSRQIWHDTQLLRDISLITDPYVAQFNSAEEIQIYLKRLVEYVREEVLSRMRGLAILSGKLHSGEVDPLKEITSQEVYRYSGAYEPFNVYPEEFEQIDYYLSLAKIYATKMYVMILLWDITKDVGLMVKKAREFENMSDGQAIELLTNFDRIMRKEQDRTR